MSLHRSIGRAEIARPAGFCDRVWRRVSGGARWRSVQRYSRAKRSRSAAARSGSCAAAGTCSRCCPKAFAGIKQIGVIGWGSQGPAQAQNLRDSLEGTGIKVKVGLRAGSASMAEAAAAGFTEENGTLGEMFEVIARVGHRAAADLRRRAGRDLRAGVRRAAPGRDAGPVARLPARPPARTSATKFPANINVIAVCPKGMGPSVRRLYVQGARGQRRRHQRQLRRPAGHRRPRDRLRARLVGRRSARRTRSRRRWSPSTSPTSSASAASCSAPCTASSRASTAASSARGMSAGGGLPQLGAKSITGADLARRSRSTGMLGVYEALDAAGKAAFERAYSRRPTRRPPRS